MIYPSRVTQCIYSREIDLFSWQFSEIDLEKNKVGIYGKVSKLDVVLNDGDRVEIYRPIICDPKTVPRKAKAADAAEE